MFEFLKKRMTAPQYRYLMNPYMQIACYVMYRGYDIEQGEKMLKLVEELKDLLLKFDQHNKQVHREDFDSYSPYNVWLDVGISQYVNRSIDALKERLFIKRNHPEEFLPFTNGIYTFYIKTKMQSLAFDPAFPNEQAREDFDALCVKIKLLNEQSDLGYYAHGGDDFSTLFGFITDQRERERELDNARSVLFQEPVTYPTYLVYPKPYRPEQAIEHQGAYITENALKTCAFYPSNADEFFQTKIYVEDLPKLDFPVKQVYGQIEFGLHDMLSEYYNDPDFPKEFNLEDEWIDTDWYYVKEIPPNTEGIPNNPLRLEHLRYPLKDGEMYISLAELKKRDGYVYQNPNAMVENYAQVTNRYYKYYHAYLQKHGVDEELMKAYWVK